MRAQSATQRGEWLTLLLAIAVFVVLAGWQLQRPGLHNDEAQEAGLQAMQLLGGQPISAFRGIGIGADNFPLMTQDYIGAWHVYWAAPFMAVFGVGPIGLRLSTLVIAVAILVAGWWAVRLWLGPRAALLTVVLLATHPSFVFWARQGVFVTSFSLLFALAALAVFGLWAQRGGWRLLGLLGLLVGWGIYAKLLFVWFVGGLLAALALLNLAPLLRRQWAALWPRRPTPVGIAAGFVGTTVGLLPLIAYNLLSQGTFLSVVDNLGTSYYGVDNAAVVSNLLTRVQVAKEVLNGASFWYLGGQYTNPWWWAITVVSAIALVALALVTGHGDRRGVRQKALVFLLLLQLVALTLSIFTVSGLFHTHMALLLPLPIILIGGTLTQRLAGFDAPHARAYVLRLVQAGLAVLLIVGNLLVVGRYHTELARVGGLGPHSDAIYELTDVLAAEATGPVVAVDWGFAPQVRQLTRDRVQPTEVFGYDWAVDDGFSNRLSPFLNNDTTLYVLHWDNEEIFPRRDAFFAFVAENGLSTERVAIVSRRDGAPMYEIVRVLGQR